MTYVISSACVDVMDQSCIEVCPVDCIHIESDDTDRMCYIEPKACIDCGVCEPACPVGAIFLDAEVPSQTGEFTEINALWFEDRELARKKVDRFMEENPSLT